MTAALMSSRRVLYAAFMGGLCLTACPGCSRREDGVVLMTGPTAPAILRSEGDQVGMAVRIDAPMTFENRSRRGQQISVSKTGCSCYGVATKEKLLEPGEWISIPAGKSQELFFVAKKIEGETEQAFRASFSMRDGDHPAASDVTANCTMRIFQDLTLDPGTFVNDLPAKGGVALPGKPDQIILRQVTRGHRPIPVPRFVMSPELLKATNFDVTGPPTEVAPGFWQTEWTSSLSLAELPESVLENGGRYAFSVELPEIPAGPERDEPRTSDDSSMPTLLDVVQDRPQRRISGQLVLRRSRGVIAPGQIHFGSVAIGERRERRIVLNAADHSPFTVQVERSPASFHVAIDSTEPAAQQWVTVTLTPEGTGELDETLILRTTHPDQPEVAVKLKARITSSADPK